MAPKNPEDYVEENQETLVKIIKHSSNDFVRSLAIAAIIEYGDDPTREDIVDTLAKLKDQGDKQDGGGSKW